MIVPTGGKLARVAAAGGLLAVAALAGPPLTTIQDVLYKADGKLFNGVAVISWKSFEAADASNITMQNLAVKIVNGALKVQLVPTTDSNPPAYYAVKYSSDGKIQFEETWQVPASSRPLRVRDVRVAAPAYVAPETGTIQESDIPGLVSDLSARPVKGPAFAPGRTAVIGMTGALEGVSGSLADCVRVDGTAGPCGGLDFTFVDAETPAGTVDGANAVFQLAAAPDPPASLAVYRNGILQKAVQDFTVTDRTLQFVEAATPQPGDTLTATYRLPGVLGGGGSFTAPQVLCSSTGQATSSATVMSLGSCVIPANTLRGGDRVEIQFDYKHQGSATGFQTAVRWGGTTVAQRSASAGESLLTGRAEAAITLQGAQVSAQIWGSTLALGATVTSASDSPANAITVDFLGNLSTASSDQLSLLHYSVVRYPVR